MFRAYVGVALGCFVLVLAGCGNRAQGVKGKPAGQKAPAADAAEITIYVEGMSERQGIT